MDIEHNYITYLQQLEPQQLIKVLQKDILRSYKPLLEILESNPQILNYLNQAKFKNFLLYKAGLFNLSNEQVVMDQLNIILPDLPTPCTQMVKFMLTDPTNKNVILFMKNLFPGVNNVNQKLKKLEEAQLQIQQNFMCWFQQHITAKLFIILYPLLQYINEAGQIKLVPIDFIKSLLQIQQNCQQNNLVAQAVLTFFETYIQNLKDQNLNELCNFIKIWYSKQNDRLFILKILQLFRDLKDTLIEQQIILSCSMMVLYQKFKHNLIEEIIEDSPNFNKIDKIVGKFFNLGLVKFEKKTSKFAFDRAVIIKIFNQIPKCSKQLIRYLFWIDRIQTADFLISYQASLAFSDYLKVEVHCKDYLMLLITHQQIQYSPIAKYILKSIDCLVIPHQNLYIKLNIARHLIHLISKNDSLTQGDILICSFMHKLFIQNRELMNDLVFQGFPIELIPKLISNVESFHVCMQNAEDLILQSKNKQFIIQFFLQITKQYPNERQKRIKFINRSDKIIEFINNQVISNQFLKQIIAPLEKEKPKSKKNLLMMVF